MHFFLSCVSSQGSTLSCLAAVLYLFCIFHMVGSRFLLQSQNCTVFRIRLCVLLSHNSLSKYSVKGRGSPLSFFSICTESENNLQTEKDMEVMDCKQLWSSKGPGKFFPSHMLLPAHVEAGKSSGRRTQAAGLCHWYLMPSPVLQFVANIQIAFY